jgi:hypothetical protein
MKCKETQGRFSEYIDEVLSLSELRDVEQHLAECAECAQELERWKDAASALSQVLARDAVPAKSLDEFVAACTAEPELTGWAAFVRLITSPRHAVASTVAGSVALTSLMLMLVWVAMNGVPSMRMQPSPMTSPLHRYEMLTEITDTPMKKGYDNGTQKDRRSDSGRVDTRIAVYPLCT